MPGKIYKRLKSRNSDPNVYKKWSNRFYTVMVNLTKGRVVENAIGKNDSKFYNHYSLLKTIEITGIWILLVQ